MSRRAPAVQYRARPSSRHSSPRPGPASRTRIATRPDPDLSPSAVPSAGSRSSCHRHLASPPHSELGHVHPLRLARLGRTGGSGRGRFCEGGSRDDSGRVPLADHVRCGFRSVSGRAQRLADRGRLVRTQSGMMLSPSSAKIHHSGGCPPRASSMLVPVGIANAHNGLDSRSSTGRQGIPPASVQSGGGL